MRRILASALSVALVAASQGAASAQSVSGLAEALDGDTLSFTGTIVKLAGVDVLEKGQMCAREGAEWACGEDARARLAELVKDSSVDCEGRGPSSEGPLVAVCRVGTVDLAEAMILAGFGFTLPVDGDPYADAQERASRFGLGMWGSAFEQPSEWRAAHPEVPPQPRRVAKAAPVRPKVYRDQVGCTIKGNQSYRGPWIYYLPGEPYYRETRPEALFCTEQEAQAAGYRPTRARW